MKTNQIANLLINLSKNYTKQYSESINNFDLDRAKILLNRMDKLDRVIGRFMDLGLTGN